MLGNELRITDPNFEKFSYLCGKFFHSVVYLVLNIAIAAMGYALNPFKVPSMFILLFLIAFNLAFCRDIMPSFLPTVLIALVPMDSANLPLGEYMVLAYATIYFVPALAVRFWLFPCKFIKGKNFWALLVLSVAVILGGLGSDITAGEYFSFYPVYTMLGLGFIQLLMYLFWQNYIPDDYGENTDYFCKMMIAIGVVSILFIAIQYIKAIPNYDEEDKFELLYFSWKNYISDILMLAMPFSFYFVTRHRLKLVSLIFGILEYVAILITQSAGGILFSTIMMPFLIIYTLIKVEKRDKITIGISILVLVIAVAAAFFAKLDFFKELFWSKITTGGTGRLELYGVGIEVFKKFPIFGAGFGYVNENGIGSDFIMFYFHSTLFQFLGASGLVGLLAYAFMAICRLKTYAKKYAFNVFLLIGFLGYAGYSMMDVGTSTPFPFVMMCTFMLVVCEKYNKYMTFGDAGKPACYSAVYKRENEIIDIIHK